MEIPEAWFRMGSMIHQDFDLDYPNFFSGIADIVKDMYPNERQSLLEFLREVLSSDCTMEELSELLEKSGADVHIVVEEENDAAIFFATILEVVEKIVGKE